MTVVSSRKKCEKNCEIELVWILFSPDKQMNTFQWIENPEKPIADSTRTLYERRLNALARAGFNTRDSLLENAQTVRSIIESSNSRQMRSLSYGAIFYILGRLDPNDPRAAILIDGFKKNYYG